MSSINYTQFSDFIKKSEFTLFSFHVEQDFTSLIDGSRNAFPLSHACASGQVALYYNGLRQRAGYSFNVNPSGLILNFIPKVGTELMVDYFI